MPVDFQIQACCIEVSSELTALTKASKAYWGFTDEQIESWKEDLTITENYITAHPIYKFVNAEGRITGYYSYSYLEETHVMLDNIFIWPEHIGSGIGKRLIEDFLQRLHKESIEKVTLYSEILAEEFYKKMGFQTRGYFWSHFSERKLPLMVKHLNTLPGSMP